MGDDKSIDWDAVWIARNTEQLTPYIERIVPRARWADRDPEGSTLLHCTAREPTALKATLLLLAHGVDVNARTAHELTPAHMAATFGNHRALELLCAAGANVALSCFGHTPLDAALLAGKDECVRVLLAHGVRLATVQVPDANIAPWMVALERGRRQCRETVAVLLGLKRRRGRVMRSIDRWVVRDLAVCCWATRAHAAWQTSRDPPLDWTGLCSGRVRILDIPSSRWRDRSAQWGTLLHVAAAVNDAPATAALCAHGLDVDARDASGCTPLQRCLRSDADGACARVLLASGAAALPVPWMQALERGCSRCRAAAVLVAGLARKRGYVGHGVALAVWSTRTHNAWQGAKKCVIQYSRGKTGGWLWMSCRWTGMVSSLSPVARAA